MALGKTADIQGILEEKMREVGIDPSTGERTEPVVKEAAAEEEVSEKEAQEETPSSDDIIARSREIGVLLRKHAAGDQSPEAKATEEDKDIEKKDPPEKTDKADPGAVKDPEEGPIKPVEGKAKGGDVKVAEGEVDEELEKAAEALVTYASVREVLEGGESVIKMASVVQKMRAHLVTNVKPYISGAAGAAVGAGAGVAAGKKYEARKDPGQKREAFRTGAVWMHNQYRSAQSAHGSKTAALLYGRLTSKRAASGTKQEEGAAQ